MGRHKNNPNVGLAKNGLLPKRPEKVSKRETEREIDRVMSKIIFETVFERTLNRGYAHEI